MELKPTLASALKRLRKTYNLSERQIMPLRRLFDLDITSVAYTIDGGFDPKTGDYYSENRGVNYKIRVKYYEGKDDATEKMRAVLAVAEEDATPTLMNQSYIINKNQNITIR